MPNPAPYNLINETLQISPARQMLYLKVVAVAVEKYLVWSQKYATGWRLSHWFHGSSGRERAMKLKKYLQEHGIEVICEPEHLEYVRIGYDDSYFRQQPNTKRDSFSEIVSKVASILDDSGYCKHSLRTFLFEQMTGTVFFTTDSFRETSNNYITIKLAQFAKSTGTPSQIENLNFWCLTNLMLKEGFYRLSGGKGNANSMKEYLQNINKIDIEQFMQQQKAADAEFRFTHGAYVS